MRGPLQLLLVCCCSLVCLLCLGNAARISSLLPTLATEDQLGYADSSTSSSPPCSLPSERLGPLGQNARALNQAQPPSESNVDAIATSALIPAEMLYGKTIPNRMPCPEGDPGVMGDNCGPDFNPCETHPVAGPANTCRRLGTYRCVPNTCTVEFQWRGVVLPSNPCTPLFLDENWGTPALWCTDPAYTGGIPGMQSAGERAAEEARRATRGLLSDYQQQAPSSPEPSVVLHGALTQTVEGGLDLNRPVKITFEDPPKQRPFGWLGRGLKQTRELPPEVLHELERMGLSADDVEIVEYPPGTDPETVMNDLRQGRRGGGSTPYSMRSSGSQGKGGDDWGEDALDEWLDQDWHMIPYITVDLGLELMDFVQQSTQQLVSSSSELAPMIQEAARSMRDAGSGYNSQFSRGNGPQNSISASISNIVSVGGSDGGSEDHGDHSSKGSGKDKGKSSTSSSISVSSVSSSEGSGSSSSGSGTSGSKHDSLKSIWDEYAKTEGKDGSGDLARSATLCKCGGEAGTVCCSGARQYSSKCEAECVQESMENCSAGPCS